MSVLIGDTGLHFVLFAVSLPGFCIRVIRVSCWMTGAMKGKGETGEGTLIGKEGESVIQVRGKKESERSPRLSEETTGSINIPQREHMDSSGDSSEIKIWPSR